MIIEKLPVPEFELLTEDVGSEFQQKMNAAMLGVKNAIIAFNAQIDANETSTDRVSQMNSLIQQVELDSNNAIVQVLTSTDAEVEVEFGGQTQLVVPYGYLQQQVEGQVDSAYAYAQASAASAAASGTLAKFYSTTATGLAAVGEGDYFQVPAPDSNVYSIIYKKFGGIAVEVKRYPSLNFFEGIKRGYNLKYPSISDSSGVELLGFDEFGGAYFKISEYVLKQLDIYFASQLEINGIEQIPQNKSPSIYDSQYVELLGFDKTGAARFKVSKSVADQIVSLMDMGAPIKAGVLPAPEIVCWGDSMTQGSTTGGTTITTVMSTDLGRVVYNRGLGGQSATAIAIRQGGYNLIVTVSGNQIPAVGSVLITNKNSNILMEGGVFKGSVHVSINGVSGLITTDNLGNWSFTRDSPGNLVTVPASVVASIDGSTDFIVDPALHRGDTVVIWAGRNGGVGGGRQAIVACRDRIVEMIVHLTPLNKRVIVVSVCNGRRLKISDGTTYEAFGSSGYNDVIALNRELADTFKEGFVDLRSYMVNHAIYDAGLLPTATDLADIAADCIPTQLMADNLHFTAAAYQIAGKYLSRQVKSRGW